MREVSEPYPLAFMSASDLNRATAPEALERLLDALVGHLASHGDFIERKQAQMTISQLHRELGQADGLRMVSMMIVQTLSAGGHHA